MWRSSISSNMIAIHHRRNENVLIMKQYMKNEELMACRKTCNGGNINDGNNMKYGNSNEAYGGNANKYEIPTKWYNEENQRKRMKGCEINENYENIETFIWKYRNINNGEEMTKTIMSAKWSKRNPCNKLVNKHPMCEIREKYVKMAS